MEKKFWIPIVVIVLVAIGWLTFYSIQQHDIRTLNDALIHFLAGDDERGLATCARMILYQDPCIFVYMGTHTYRIKKLNATAEEKTQLLQDYYASLPELCTTRVHSVHGKQICAQEISRVAEALAQTRQG